MPYDRKDRPRLPAVTLCHTFEFGAPVHRHAETIDDDVGDLVHDVMPGQSPIYSDRPSGRRPGSTVELAGDDCPIRIEPTADGCRVTEWNHDLRPDSVLEFSAQVSGIEDRTERNRQTISVTLERLAAALEGANS